VAFPQSLRVNTGRTLLTGFARPVIESGALLDEFVRRAGYALVWALSVHDRTAPDARFLDALARIEAADPDPRPYVRKAADMALRATGKRNPALRAAADLDALDLRAFTPAAAVRGAAWLPSLVGVLVGRFGLEAVGWSLLASALGLITLHEVLQRGVGHAAQPIG